MIQLRNVIKDFEGRRVLDGVSLSVERGEKIAIIGASGCGKSTTLRLMIGLQRPEDGEVYVDGQPVHQLNPRQMRDLRLKFGMLFQSGALFDSMNVFQNVAFSLVEVLGLPPDQIRARVSEVLDMVKMQGFEEAMPSDLSGGQKKRIGLARAIAASPEIVLYDEPTTGLDPIMSTEIEDLIVELNHKLTVTSVVVTHQHSTILRTADKIYMMHEGVLLPAERPDTIMDSQNDVIRRFIHGGNPP